MEVIGIDVGAKGHLAHIKDTTVINILRFDKCQIPGYAEYLKHLSCPIIVEEVHAMPKQGVTSMFSFGTRFGEILGMLGTLGKPFILKKPQAWQKSIMFQTPYSNNSIDKKINIAYAVSEVFSSYNFLNRNNKPNTDLTDAVAIAYSHILDTKKS